MDRLSWLKRALKGPLRGMQAGTEVIIERPHRITHPERISIGDRTFIHRNALISPIVDYQGVSYDPRIEIGSDIYIGPNVYMACIGGIVIGDGTVLSENVFINDCNHGMDPEAGLIMKQQLVHGGNIVIGNSCFIGLRCAIMPGVTLGNHCIVGINSVVTTSFPSYSMIAGTPARLLRIYDHDLKSWIKPEAVSK